jgi:hypothetical protein
LLPNRRQPAPALSSAPSILHREVRPPAAPGSAHSAYGLRAPTQRSPALQSSDQRNRTVPEKRSSRDND